MKYCTALCQRMAFNKKRLPTLREVSRASCRQCPWGVARFFLLGPRPYPHTSRQTSPPTHPSVSDSALSLFYTHHLSTLLCRSSPLDPTPSSTHFHPQLSMPIQLNILAIPLSSFTHFFLYSLNFHPWTFPPFTPNPSHPLPFTAISSITL